MKLSGLIMLGSLAQGAWASDRVTSFAPDNDWHKYDSLDRDDANIDEAKFNEIIDYVTSFYKDLASGQDAKLVVERKWTDPTVNAFANQTGKDWKISMYGGLARRDEITADGFALVVCHELGHHFAGYPFYSNTDWAAAEGQSDYFATQVCGKRMWHMQTDENARHRETVDATAKQACDARNTSEADQNLCYRLTNAGKSLADLLAALGSEKPVNFDTPDKNIVTNTQTAHPKGQCRLDTFFRGALCSRSTWIDTLIPARRHPEGQVSLEAYLLATQYACNEIGLTSYAARPRCWFAPKLEMILDSSKFKLVQREGNNNGSWDPGETFDINLPLTNATLNMVSEAKLTLASRSTSATIENPTVMYPNIASGATEMPEQPITVKVANDAKCGAKIGLTATVKAGNKTATKNLEYMLGRLVSLAPMKAEPKLAIPDDSTKGITEKFAVMTEKRIQQAVVTVDISHERPKDLRLSLVTAAGKTHVLRNRIEGDADIKQAFTLTIPNEVAKGDWKLIVQDLDEEMEGTLNNWGLTLHTISCE